MCDKTLVCETSLKLFRAIPENETMRIFQPVTHTDNLLRAGIVILGSDNKVLRGNFLKTSADLILDVYGADQAIWDQTFHKSWEKVATAPIEQLVFEQLVHYFSTYGMEYLGYQATPILPVEKVLTDPNTFPNIRAFTIIRLVSEGDFQKMVDEYLVKTLAPHKNLVKGIIEMMDYAAVTNIDNIASFELKVARCEVLGIVPKNPTDFLRFLVYKTTGSTMLIKSNRALNEIREKAACSGVLKNYFARADLTKLASIFYRFKPIFLAFKKAPGCAKYINKIRRLAKTFHEPQSDVNVQNVMNLIMDGRMDDAKDVISRCTGRQLIKLMNYGMAEELRYNVTPKANPVYLVRNGRAFVKQETPQAIDFKAGAIDELQELVCDALDAKFMGKLAGKVYHLPNYVNYTVPVSEKQFIGNIPYGSWIQFENGEPLTMGVAWENYKGQRTDIDLHMDSLSRSFGWNTGYRSDSRDVMYSGDMTDATNGAAEVFRFVPDGSDKEHPEVFLLTVNNYTQENGVPFKFLITEEEFEGEYVWGRTTPPIDVSGAVFPPIPLKFDDANAMTLGLVYGDAFFFYGGELGTSIIPKRDLYKDFITAMTNRMSGMVQVRALLTNAGADIVDDEDYAAMTEEERAEVIDLAPAALTARSLLDLVDIGD
jgi:hypothetical protein